MYGKELLSRRPLEGFELADLTSLIHSYYDECITNFYLRLRLLSGESVYELVTTERLSEGVINSLNYNFKSLGLEARLIDERVTLLISHELNYDKLRSFINEQLTYSYGLIIKPSELKGKIRILYDSLWNSTGSQLMHIRKEGQEVIIELNNMLNREEVIDLEFTLTNEFKTFKKVLYKV